MHSDRERACNEKIHASYAIALDRSAPFLDGDCTAREKLIENCN